MWYPAPSQLVAKIFGQGGDGVRSSVQLRKGPGKAAGRGRRGRKTPGEGSLSC